MERPHDARPTAERTVKTHDNHGGSAARAVERDWQDHRQSLFTVLDCTYSPLRRQALCTAMHWPSHSEQHMTELRCTPSKLT